MDFAKQKIEELENSRHEYRQGLRTLGKQVNKGVDVCTSTATDDFHLGIIRELSIAFANLTEDVQ